MPATVRDGRTDGRTDRLTGWQVFPLFPTVAAARTESAKLLYRKRLRVTPSNYSNTRIQGMQVRILQLSLWPKTRPVAMFKITWRQASECSGRWCVFVCVCALMWQPRRASSCLHVPEQTVAVTTSK